MGKTPGPRHRTSHWAPHCARHRGRPGCGRSGGHAPAPWTAQLWKDEEHRSWVSPAKPWFDMVWYVFLIFFVMSNVDSLANMVGWTGQTYYINMSQNGDYMRFQPIKHVPIDPRKIGGWSRNGVCLPSGNGSKPCSPGEHQNRWQMDVHPLINCIYRYWSIAISDW